MTVRISNEAFASLNTGGGSPQNVSLVIAEAQQSQPNRQGVIAEVLERHGITDQHGAFTSVRDALFKLRSGIESKAGQPQVIGIPRSKYPDLSTIFFLKSTDKLNRGASKVE